MNRNLNLELNQCSNDDIDTGTSVCAYVRKRVRVSESIIEPESRARKVMMTQTTVDNIIGIRILYTSYSPI